MRSFILVITSSLLLLLSPLRAEETQYKPHVDVVGIKTPMDVYYAKQWAAGRRYDRMQEVGIRYDRLKQEIRFKYYGQDLEALKVVRAAANEAYVQWLDAHEMMEWERAVEIEEATPEFQTYRAEVEKHGQARDEELAVLKEEEERHLLEIQAIYEAEIGLIEQAYEQVKAGQ